MQFIHILSYNIKKLLKFVTSTVALTMVEMPALCVTVWLSGVHWFQQCYSTSGPLSTRMDDYHWLCKPSRYVDHLDQLILAFCLWLGIMSTSEIWGANG